MFKLVVLCAVTSVAFARPGYVSHLDTPVVYHSAPAHHQEYVQIHEPTITKVGSIVESVPSAVSHQSSTVVHSKAHVVTPILSHGVKTYHTPIVHSYESAPIISSYEGASLYDAHDLIHASPVVYGYHDDSHYHHHY